jgi:integrase
VRKFLVAIKDERLFAPMLLSLLGMRPAEVCGLRWSDVDLAAEELRIENTRTLVDGEMIEKDTKSEDRQPEQEWRTDPRRQPGPAERAKPGRAHAGDRTAGPAGQLRGHGRSRQRGPSRQQWLGGRDAGPSTVAASIMRRGRRSVVTRSSPRRSPTSSACTSSPESVGWPVITFTSASIAAQRMR